MSKVKKFLDYLFSKTKFEDECIFWPFSKQPSGYGKFKKNRKMFIAHRFVLQKISGEDGLGLDACHKCHNPSCVNPKHLYWGTRSKNMQDRIENGTVTFTKEEIIEIRRDKRSNVDIAKDHNVHDTTISAIKTGKYYKYVYED